MRWFVYMLPETDVLDMLKWARAQKPACPWNEQVCEEAARGGFVRILEWALAQKPPCPSSGFIYWRAAHQKQWNVIFWLRRRNPPYGWAHSSWWLSCAAEHKRWDIVRWARDQNPPCPWSEEVCKVYAKKLPARGFWKPCNGYEPRMSAARGPIGFVFGRPETATSKCCNGHELRTRNALGPKRFEEKPAETEIFPC